MIGTLWQRFLTRRRVIARPFERSRQSAPFYMIVDCRRRTRGVSSSVVTPMKTSTHHNALGPGLQARSLLLSVITAAISCALMLTGCTISKRAPTPSDALLPVSAPKLEDSGDPATLDAALAQSVAYLTKLPETATVQYGGDSFAPRDLLEGLFQIREQLQRHGLSEPFFSFLATHCRFYESSASKVLFTGYYEASLKGSWTRTARFRYPVYRKPDDLVTINVAKFFPNGLPEGVPATLRGRLKDNAVDPYFTRDEIDFGRRLSGKRYEILWVDDPIKLFFLHIQGSGSVEMTDGTTVRIGYGDTNGHRYQAIGKYLIDRGELQRGNVTMQSIVDWMTRNPEQMREVMQYNPSYIFFRKLDTSAVGSIGVPLTPYRSIATDRSLFPKGALAFIRTELPQFDSSGNRTGTRDFVRLVMNQDTGGAIKGPGRVDIFTGRGEESEWVAGQTQQYGSVYFCAPVSG